MSGTATFWLGIGLIVLALCGFVAGQLVLWRLRRGMRQGKDERP